MWKTNSSAFIGSTLCVFLCLFLVKNLSAQRNLTLFNLHAVPQSYSLHPGRMPLSNVYFSLPVLGNLNGNYSNSGFSFGDLGLGSDSEMEDFFGNDFGALSGVLGKENRLNIDFNTNWVDFGFRIKKNFFSFQVAEHINLQADYPRSLFELLDDVSQGEVQQTTAYDLSMLGINGLHYRTFGIGYTRSITPTFSAGVKLKLLSGLSNVSTLNQGLEFLNNQDDAFLLIRGSLDVFSSGLQTLEEEPEAYIRGTGNRGFAMDLGAHFQPKENIELFASMINIGKIKWKNDLTYNAIIAGNVQFSTSDIDTFEMEVERFVDSLQTQTSISAYETRLPMMVYLGGNYYFKPNTAVGVLFNPRFFERQTDLAFSVSLQTRVNRFLQAIVNYAVYNKSAFNLGAGLALNAGPLQLYMVSDNFLPLFNLEKAKHAHLNAGLNLSFGRMTRAQQMMTFSGDPIGDISGADNFAKTKKSEQAEEKEPLATEPVPAVVQEKPDKKNKAKDTEKPAVIEETPKPFVILNANAQTQSGEALAGITTEVYKLLPNENEEFVLIKSFLDGKISLVLQRNEFYKIVILKPGFAAREIKITPDLMAGMTELKREIVLAPAPPPAPKKVEPSDPPAERQEASQPSPAEQTTSAVIGTANVKITTNLRQTPAQNAAVLVRIPADSLVEILEKTNEQWWKVKYWKRIGYVSVSALTSSK